MKMNKKIKITIENFSGKNRLVRKDFERLSLEELIEAEAVIAEAIHYKEKAKPKKKSSFFEGVTMR